jgi:hypothetical protein
LGDVKQKIQALDMVIDDGGHGFDQQIVSLEELVPAPDFLSKASSAFDDPSVGYIGGRVMRHDPTDDPMMTNESMTPTYLSLAGHSFARGLLWAQTWPFRRSVLLNIGG